MTAGLEESLIQEFPSRPLRRLAGPQGMPVAAERCGLWIFCVGIGNCARNPIDLAGADRRSFGYFSLAHVYGGGGAHWMPGAALQRVGAGDVVISLPEQDHIYGPQKGEEWREDWLGFTGPRAEMLRESGMLAGGVLPRALNFRRVREIARLAREQAYDGLLRAAGLLELLLVDLHLHQQKQRQKQATGALAVVRTLAGEIVAAPESAWTLAAMSARAGISQSHLRRVFREAYELSPQEYVEQARLRKAAQLLQDTLSPVTEVAAAVGYADPFYFSTCFRRCFGLTPSAYRKITLHH